MGGIVGVIMGLTSFGTNTGEITNSNSTNIVLVSEKESKQLCKTENGRCYNKNGCSYLRYSQIKVTDEKIIENELNPIYSIPYKNYNQWKLGYLRKLK